MKQDHLYGYILTIDVNLFIGDPSYLIPPVSPPCFVLYALSNASKKESM